MAISLLFRASGEAISGTQRYFSKHYLIVFSRLRRGDLRYTTLLFKALSFFFRASGEAILGTLKYVFDAFYG